MRRSFVGSKLTLALSRCDAAKHTATHGPPQNGPTGSSQLQIDLQLGSSRRPTCLNPPTAPNPAT